MLDFGMNSMQAGDAPRWRHDESSQPMDSADASFEVAGILILEFFYANIISVNFEKKDHKILAADFYYGGYGHFA